MNAFVKLNKGLMRQRLPVRLWVMLLAAFNLVVPLFFLDRREAQLVVATFLAGAMLMTAITALAGFTRLLGLGHVLWIPLLYFLWTRLAQIPPNDIFGLWVRTLMALNAVSLLIDIADVGRYVAGDRGETVSDL